MTLDIVGGIGCFLLGMSLLVDGLKALAGGALRRTLTSAVRGPMSGFLAGAATTALVQSSSATTVATIGFVSAGLLTFPQSIGVVLGANVGTTSTSWLVAVLGLRISIGSFALPILAIGALLRVLGRGRLAEAGLAIAGFGLLFVGLSLLEDGMAAATSRFGPDSLPTASTLGGRAMLTLSGLAMTVIMQSSSAAIATVIVALSAGSLGFDQAIAVVVGANVGTTVTAGLAAIGASVPARRTAIVHVLFNVAVAIAAFAALPWIGEVSIAAAGLFAPGDLPIAVACFHSLVKLAGAAVFLALVVPLAKLLVAAVPMRDDALVRNLDRSVASAGPVAVEALRRTIAAILARVAGSLDDTLAGRGSATRLAADLREARAAIDQSSAFAATLGRGVQGEREVHEQLGCLHALDHATRLIDVIEPSQTVAAIAGEPGLGPQREALAACLGHVAGRGREVEQARDAEALERISATIAGLRKAYRVEVLEAAARGEIDPELALRRLDASRGIDQVAYHCWRAAAHLEPSSAEPRPDAPAP